MLHSPLPTETSPLLSSGTQAKDANTVYIYLVAGLSAIGGFLFGYDTGIISGAIIFIRDVFHLNEWWQEAIVSSTLLTAWIFSILAGNLTDRLGRKPVIVASSFIFIAGSVLMAIAWTEYILLAGRMVVGAAVGLASMTIPMYIAEVAPSSIRGQLVMIYMCCITGGQFFASVIAYWFSYIEGNEGWRFMLGFAAIPAVIQFLAFIFMPESPRWLVSKKRDTEAKLVLAKIRAKGADTSCEFEAIKLNHLAALREQEAHNNPDQNTFSRILNSPPVYRALIVGCILQLVQQISGINTVMYYSASIFQMSGVYSKHKALLLSAGTALVNFVFTLVGFILVERMGRRRLTLISLFGVVISLVILAAGFQFAYYKSPAVNQWDHNEINHPCDLAPDCSSCVRHPECGFCFTEAINNSAPALECLHVNSSHNERSLLGQCSIGTSSGYVWAYEWCPSSYSWLTMLGMVLYLMFFAPGMGPMPWTINSEIYPSWARSWCLSATTSVNWLSNLVMSMTFLSLTGAITKHGAFYLYALLSSAGFVYFLCVLPETRGRALEELEDLFADKSTSKQSQQNTDETNHENT